MPYTLSNHLKRPHTPAQRAYLHKPSICTPDLHRHSRIYPDASPPLHQRLRQKHLTPAVLLACPAPLEAIAIAPETRAPRSYLHKLAADKHFVSWVLMLMTPKGLQRIPIPRGQIDTTLSTMTAQILLHIHLYRALQRRCYFCSTPQNLFSSASSTPIMKCMSPAGYIRNGGVGLPN